MGMSEEQPAIELNAFAFRQFDDENYSGTRVSYESKDAFIRRVSEIYSERLAMEKEFGDRPALIDGYAPFCKHLFVPNFCGSLVGAVEITPENEGKLRTSYEARTEKELPVLTRYFPTGSVEVPEASFLDLILYSREQMIKEAGSRSESHSSDCAWSLISIKAQDVPHELPMTPITVMRNALISEGGSGVNIDRDAYLASVAYWRSHAMVGSA